MRAPSFTDLLDEALGRPSPASPGPRAWALHGAPRQATPFLFARPLTAATPRWTAGLDPRPRRAHQLSGAERWALDRLLDLGAALAPDFSVDELRRAYRLLAHRYHPDRHAASDAVTQASMAGRFSEVSTAYRCLRAVVEPRH